MSLTAVSGGKLVEVTVNHTAEVKRKAAARLRSEALDLRQNPGELAQDPRFLNHLISDRESRAEALEAEADLAERANQAPAARIAKAFLDIREELGSAYVLVAECRAPRRDQWHPVQVTLQEGAGSKGTRIRTPQGYFW